MAKKRCAHQAVPLFNKPPKSANDGLKMAWLLLGQGRDWVRCTVCGSLGYWGGYSHKRRIRWGYDLFKEQQLVQATEWNTKVEAT